MKQAVLYLTNKSNEWTLSAFHALEQSLQGKADVYFAYHQQGDVLPVSLQNIENQFVFTSDILSELGITGNISNLLQINEKASIILRVNYTPDSISHLAIVDDLEKNIPLRFRSRILVDLHKIWQVNEEDVSLEKLDLLQKKFVEKHFRLNTCGMFEPCYVEKRHFETIYYNGKVDICDNFAYGNARGVITNEGYVNWGQENVFPEIPSECMGCVYYPVCLGECPAIRLKNKQQGKTFVCNASVKEHIEFAIKDYCLRTINNKKLS